jgi:hypothetical protein
MYLESPTVCALQQSTTIPPAAILLDHIRPTQPPSTHVAENKLPSYPGRVLRRAPTTPTMTPVL